MERIVARWKMEAGLPPVPGQKVSSLTAATSAPVEVPLSWVKDDMKLLPKDELGPTFTGDTDFTGTYVVYDWETRKIIWKANWGQMVAMPAGHCFADGFLYMCDLEAGNIFQVDVDGNAGKLMRRISHPYLNDIHSLERTRRGLLVTASGTDAILELDLDGNLLWEWWATEHGYSMTPSGKERTSGRGQEHRNIYYHTRYQTTHLNCATIQDPDTERFVLALLFHQGQLIRIDRNSPVAEQRPQVILEGLARPHSLEKVPEGWIFCNSLSKEMVILDDDLKVIEHIPYDGGWIQDCTRLPNGNILLNDVDKHVLVEFAGRPWEIVNKTDYDQNWRMGELVIVPKEHEHAFLQASSAVS
ncbi:MAG: hypothetical protein U0Q18_29245 [Bryobacteraceae bacterium]